MICVITGRLTSWLYSYIHVFTRRIFFGQDGRLGFIQYGAAQNTDYDVLGAVTHFKGWGGSHCQCGHVFWSVWLIALDMIIFLHHFNE